MTEKKLGVYFEFTEQGCLKSILLEADSHEDQAVLEAALDRLLNPRRFIWVRRLFKKNNEQRNKK